MKFRKDVKHGDVTGGFNSSSLERSMEHVRNAFLSCITMLQDGGDPKPYLITSYALTLIGNYEVRDAIVNEFEDALDNLSDGRYSPAGIRECIAVWAAISEYMGMFGADKKVTVMGESTDFVEEHFSEEDLQFGSGKEPSDDNVEINPDEVGNEFGDGDLDIDEEDSSEKDKTERFEGFQPTAEEERIDSEDYEPEEIIL